MRFTVQSSWRSPGVTRRAALVAATAVVAALLLACTDRSTDANPRQNPPRPTPSSPQPGQTASNFDEALELALPAFTGRGWTLAVARVERITYVETTLAQAEEAFGYDERGGIGGPPGRRAWVFVAYGEFQYSGRGRATPVYPTSYAIVIGDSVEQFVGLTDERFDLSQLGTEVVIRPGEVPEIDAVRVTPDS